MLLNLEAAGTLSIVGDDQAADDVLRALAVEIVTSDLTGRIALVADESFADLADAFEPARMHSTPDHTRTRRARAEAHRGRPRRQRPRRHTSKPAPTGSSKTPGSPSSTSNAHRARC